MHMTVRHIDGLNQHSREHYTNNIGELEDNRNKHLKKKVCVKISINYASNLLILKIDL